jgi:hypothetical protein
MDKNEKWALTMNVDGSAFHEIKDENGVVIAEVTFDDVAAQIVREHNTYQDLEAVAVLVADQCCGCAIEADDKCIHELARAALAAAEKE